MIIQGIVGNRLLLEKSFAERFAAKTFLLVQEKDHLSLHSGPLVDKGIPLPSIDRNQFLSLYIVQEGVRLFLERYWVGNPPHVGKEDRKIVVPEDFRSIVMERMFHELGL